MVGSEFIVGSGFRSRSQFWVQSAEQSAFVPRELLSANRSCEPARTRTERTLQPNSEPLEPDLM